LRKEKSSLNLKFKGVGPNTNDAWRIFCKDKMYEKAGIFMVEQGWKEVMPKGEQLQAYLVWRWAKEGFYWDPETGVATPEVPKTDDLNLAESPHIE
jgi:hypothetical protein